MKLSVAVNVKGTEVILGKLSEVQKLKPMHTLLTEAADIAKTTARANAPSFTGKLSGGFVAEISPMSATVHTINEKYPVVMEGGRKPGGKMPPPKMLEQWARKHGIENTFILARSIAKRGIKGRFFRRKARAAVRKEMPRLIDRMASQVEAEWGK